LERAFDIALLGGDGGGSRRGAVGATAIRGRGELAASLRSFPVGNYIVFYLPLPDGINVVRILNGYRDITADDMD
jgi:plasmid stabilization system protein ParE